MASSKPGGDDTDATPGPDLGDDDVTVNELPEPTLDVHRPYVMALVAVISPLHETALLLAQVLHEFRVAREPQFGLIEKMARAGDVIEGVGHKLATEFRK
jgi:hypothetical protein